MSLPERRRCTAEGGVRIGGARRRARPGRSAVRLAGTPCSTALMLGLAEAIDRAGRGDSRAVIITPPAEPGSATWQWEFADTLVERC
jgi:hypothetical protein